LQIRLPSSFPFPLQAIVRPFPAFD
jgi:hypothetical protein